MIAFVRPGGRSGGRQSRKEGKHIRSSSLESARYPTAEFVPLRVAGLPPDLPTEGQATFQLVGDLTVHGVMKPLTWDITASFSGDQIAGRATTRFQFEESGMQVPRVFVVLSVEDKIQLEIDFKANKST